MLSNYETNNVNEYNMVKNPNWQEADQFPSTSMAKELN